MMESHSIDAARERAALYAAGALSNDELQDLEAHLQSGCALCQSEVDAFAVAGAALGESAVRRQPRPALRQLVQDAVARLAEGPAVTESDGVRFVRGQLLPWECSEEGAPQLKRLHHDPQRGYRSVLVRMRPGDAYPRHRHADVEEVYLIEGDITLNGVKMQAGDYCRAEPGSTHTKLSTEHGCTFIVFASERDEILAE